MAEVNRPVSTALNLPAKLVVGLLRVYQWLISPMLGPRCRFYPSCSQYFIQAVQTHGLWRGTRLGLSRLMKCHPGHEGGIDEVPPASHSDPAKLPS